MAKETDTFVAKDLISRVSNKRFSKYLLEIHLHNVRAFRNQKIAFSFPVTAIIGTNGGGKSTILGAAALAYKTSRPAEYFPKSNVGDTSMANWRIDYSVLDRTVAKLGTLNRNARFVSAKWRRDDVAERDVISFPIQRTVPASEQKKIQEIHRNLQKGRRNHRSPASTCDQSSRTNIRQGP